MRVAYSVAPNGAIITQENHFGPTGELLEGTSSNSEVYPYLFQGKERELSWGLDLDDFQSRLYGSWENRMWQVDGADQFASGYTGMGNNAVNGTDPDGQWVHIAIGAAIGGLVNLGVKAYQGKIRSFKDGAVAFGIGAVAGGITAATGGAGAVYASTGSFAGAFSSAAVAVSSTGVLGGAIAGTVGSAFGSGIQGVGNAAYFGDPYSASQYGRDVLFGGILGGVGGGISAALQGKPFFTGGNNYSFLQKPSLGGGLRPGHGGLGGDITSQFPDFVEPSGKVHKGGNYTTRSSNVASVEARLSLYPNVIDPRTGMRIPLNPRPPVPQNLRVDWNKDLRGNYIREYIGRGYPNPAGGWAEYDIHHILPRQYGGTNDFWNLVPVLRRTHQNEFNNFWKLFGH
ncbi:MAG: hypothetical protein EAZ70_04770 [Runella slithyformis]|nr:MAG: hypothetical protein EAY79_05130 [Runella slithyformis]TAF28665.1 MAG: hypothetical protein EAZ70_04770 [Runella slithyformis]TAF82382.1 MAG: hypothetical protein EAZ50_04275 [Runella slithyformis]